MQNLTLNIGGMNCGGCARNVARILEEIPGVEAVRVDLDGKKADVSFDPVAVTPDALLAAVDEGGYDASL